MTIFIGKPAMDFTSSAVMPDNSIEENFNLQNYVKGYKVVLFFYPLDFTFVCPSEIIAFNNRLGEFTTRKTKVVAISIDSHFAHLAWKSLDLNEGGVGNIQIPMVSDISKNIAKDYNVLNDAGVSMRGTFIIDENFILRHISVNDLGLGRNVDEYIRLIDAIDYTAKYGEVCPAGWHKGNDAITPSQKGIADYLISNADKL